MFGIPRWVKTIVGITLLNWVVLFILTSYGVLMSGIIGFLYALVLTYLIHEVFAPKATT